VVNAVKVSPFPNRVVADIALDEAKLPLHLIGSEPKWLVRGKFRDLEIGVWQKFAVCTQDQLI
jgi:hypothetical protein